jgi:hypothetical protein
VGVLVDVLVHVGVAVLVGVLVLVEVEVLVDVLVGVVVEVEVAVLVRVGVAVEYPGRRPGLGERVGVKSTEQSSVSPFMGSRTRLSPEEALWLWVVTPG